MCIHQYIDCATCKSKTYNKANFCDDFKRSGSCDGEKKIFIKSESCYKNDKVLNDYKKSLKK